MNMTEKKIASAVRLAFGVLSGSVLVAGTVMAQTAPVTNPTAPIVQKVTVTGSNIKRTDVETASPIQVITRDELERSGEQSLGEVIKNLTANNVGGETSNAPNGFTPGLTAPSLRGLGGGSTLILVNGRRIARYGITGAQGSFSNLDSIPKDAVDRIEILLDGASAIYGSEAVAGVINIWLRKDYEGVQVKLGASGTTKGTTGRDSVQFAAGKGDIVADKYNFMAFYDRVYQRELAAKSINAYNTQDYRGLGITRGDFRSTFSTPGNAVFQTTPTTQRLGTLPGCEPRNINDNNLCVLDSYDYINALPETLRNSLFSRAAFALNANTTAFVEAGVTRRHHRRFSMRLAEALGRLQFLAVVHINSLLRM
jgi:iron complex outermembrane recepter protein